MQLAISSCVTHCAIRQYRFVRWTSMTSRDSPRVGNAKIQGLVEQLDLTGNRYNIALVRSSIFNTGLIIDSTTRRCTLFPIVCSSARRSGRCFAFIFLSPHATCSLVLKKFRPSRCALASRPTGPVTQLMAMQMASRDHGGLGYRNVLLHVHCHACAHARTRTLMGLVKDYPQLVGVRVCLGIAEAGLCVRSSFSNLRMLTCQRFPGVVY